MYTGPSRVIDFDPTILLSHIDLNTNNEVLIRRQISTMYLAAFNFWSALEYYNLISVGKGRSKEPDDYLEVQFDSSLIGKKVDREIIALSTYRSACDHRVANPAKNIVFLGKNPPIKIPSLILNNDILKKAHLSFSTIIDLLKMKYGIP